MKYSTSIVMTLLWSVVFAQEIRIRRPQFVYVCFRRLPTGFSQAKVPLMNIYIIIVVRFFVCKESLTRCRLSNLLHLCCIFFRSGKEVTERKTVNCKRINLLDFSNKKSASIEPCRELRLNRLNKLTRLTMRI